MATLTGPQLEVIALLAEGTPLAAIPAAQGGTVDDVHDHIWAACRAVGAVDRINLVAIAYRARMLRVPGIPAAFPEGSAEHLSAELDRTIEAAAAARADARAARAEAEQATANARNAQTLAERKLATARNDLAAEVEHRESVERQLQQAQASPPTAAPVQQVDPAEVEQLRTQLAQAKAAAVDSDNGRQIAAKKLAESRTELKEAVASRAAMERARDQQQAMYQRLADLYKGEQARATAAEAAAKKAAPGGAQLHAAAGPWDLAINHLEQLAAQTRDAAQRGGLTMLHTAKGVDLAIAALRRAGGA